MDRHPPQDRGLFSVGEDRAGARSSLVEVALATCNSARFLGELLDSLFAQTFQDFTVLISDDGSSDTTLTIVGEYQRRHPGRIRLLGCERLGGPVGNFSRIMGCLSADYVVFCDHDDVWLPDKIALSLTRMRALEAQWGVAIPLLVHTDLIVVGPNLELLSPSAFQYQKILPTRNHLNALLMANIVSGCTAMANRVLYETASPVPASALMHDYWLALVAAVAGQIRCLDTPTILYRQHDRNTVGATCWSTRHIAKRAWQILTGDDRGRLLERQSEQAAALLSRCAGAMSLEQRRAATTLATLWSATRWRRFFLLWRDGLLLHGVIRNIGLCIAVTKHDPRGGHLAPAAGHLRR